MPGCFGARRNAELAIYVLDITGHSVLRDVERGRDLAIAQAAPDEPEYLALTPREDVVQGSKPTVLPLAATHTLRSVVREAVQNALKHAGATSIRIAIDLDDGVVTVTVIDDGGGFDPDAVRAGNGLANMRERVTSLGDQNTLLGGTTDIRAGYVKLEALGQITGDQNSGLWGIVTGTGLWGNADITRNYLINGGVVDSSLGRTDVQGYSLRGRLQWENAIPHISPYGELSYAHTCLGAYTETGGAFPAAFNTLCDGSTEVRYGFDAKVPVTKQFRLIGALEGVSSLREQRIERHWSGRRPWRLQSRRRQLPAGLAARRRRV